VLPQIELYPAL